MLEVETRLEGPLDTVRRLNAEAKEWQEIAISYVGDDVEKAREIDAELSLLNAMHPLIDNEVKVYGRVVTPGMDEQGVFEGMILPRWNSRPRPVPEGVYQGYTVSRVYDETTGVAQFRIFHLLEGETEKSHDAFGHRIERTFLTYIDLEDSEVVPLYPLDAHSMVDLEKFENQARNEESKILPSFDFVAYDDSLSADNQLLKIARIATRFLITPDYSPEASRQYLSYMNHSEVLAGTSVMAKEVILASPYGLKLVRHPEGKGMWLRPRLFNQNPAYIIGEDDHSTSFRSHMDLYVEGELEETGFTACIAVKKLLAAKREENYGRF